MDAGNADVIEPIDRVAHQLGRDRRLFRDRDVGRAGRTEDDGARARRNGSLHGNGPGHLVVLSLGHQDLDRLPGGFVGPGDQEGVAPADDLGGNCRNLGRCLAQSEDDFGKALPHRPMVVDLCKPKVLKGLVPKRAQELGVSLGGVGPALADLFQNGA